jgi:hypothetical protein
MLSVVKANSQDVPILLKLSAAPFCDPGRYCVVSCQLRAATNLAMLRSTGIRDLQPRHFRTEKTAAVLSLRTSTAEPSSIKRVAAFKPSKIAMSSLAFDVIGAPWFGQVPHS